MNLSPQRAHLLSMRPPTAGEAVFRPQCDQPVGAIFRAWDLLREGRALRRATLFYGGSLSP